MRRQPFLCLRLELAGLRHEIFICIQLDAQIRVIAIEELFQETLTQTSVYPRSSRHCFAPLPQRAPRVFRLAPRCAQTGALS